MRALLAVLATVTAMQAGAACKWVWVDDDYNAMTPAVKKQVCDNSWDSPAVDMPSVRPIQQPQVRPLEYPSVPPIGTTRCRNESVYENGRWVTKRICN